MLCRSEMAIFRKSKLFLIYLLALNTYAFEPESSDIEMKMIWPVPGSVHPGGVVHFNYTVSRCPLSSYVAFELDDMRVGGEGTFFVCQNFMWHGMTSVEPGHRKAMFSLHVFGQPEPLAHTSTFIEVVSNPGRCVHRNHWIQSIAA